MFDLSFTSRLICAGKTGAYHSGVSYMTPLMISCQPCTKILDYGDTTFFLAMNGIHDQFHPCCLYYKTLCDSNKLVFDQQLTSSLIFAGKAEAYHSGAPLMISY